MMAFIWIALVYVIVAFADITAGTFVAGSEELKAAAVAFNPGGAVAAASVLYLGLSLVLGLVQRFLNPPLWLVTVIFVPATFALSWAGTQMSNAFVMSHKGCGRCDPRLLLRRVARPPSGRCCSRAGTSAASSSTRRSRSG